MRGASTVIKAVADGRKAAVEIINKASDEIMLHHESNKHHHHIDLMVKRSERQYRQTHLTDAAAQILSLTEANSPGLTEQEAISEAGRCLHCDEICNICVTVCPNRANYSYEISPQKILLQKAVLNDNKEIVFKDDEDLHIHQRYQVLNIADFCNECGNCTTFCPTSGRPFADKPRFFINAAKFRDSDFGYMLKIFPDKINLIRKSNGEIQTLKLENDKYMYEDNHVQAYFMAPDFEMIHVKFTDHQIKEYRFMEAAEMYILLNAVKSKNFLHS